MVKEINKIDRLINKLCPRGVEFKKFHEVCNLRAGDRIIKSMMVDTFEYPVMGGGTLPTGHYNDYNFEKAITISRAGSAGYVNWLPGRFWATDVCFVATQKNETVLIKYVYYFVKNKSKDFKDHLYGGSMPKLDKAYLWKLPVPIPPLAIQEEIVKALDIFTELEAELEAELGARKKQYEHYRKELMLSYSGENKTLDDIYDFQYGEGNTIPTTGGEYPVYGGNSLAGRHDKYNSEDAPVIGHIGAYAGIVNWVNGKHFVTYNGVICKIKSGVNPKFGYHLLVLQDFRSKANAGSQPFVSYDMLKKTTVKIPDISTQNKIADTLDKFDALVNDISIGLPAEIKARRQQYEYYQNKLLTFKEYAN